MGTNHIVKVFLKSGFGVNVGSFAAHVYPKASFPPPRGGGQGVGKMGISDFKKALIT